MRIEMIEIIFYLGNSLNCNLYPLDVMDSILRCDDHRDVLQNVKLRLIQRIVLNLCIYTSRNLNIYRNLALTSMMVVIMMVVSKK